MPRSTLKPSAASAMLSTSRCAITIWSGRRHRGAGVPERLSPLARRLRLNAGLSLRGAVQASDCGCCRIGMRLTVHC